MTTPRAYSGRKAFREGVQRSTKLPDGVEHGTTRHLTLAWSGVNRILLRRPQCVNSSRQRRSAMPLDYHSMEIAMSLPVIDTSTRLPLLMRHPVRWVAHSAICAAFLQHAAVRFLNFEAAVSEMEHYGLLPAAPIAAVVILIQIGCSVMILSGFWRWIGAMILCIFTLASTVLAMPFWNQVPGVARLTSADSFMANIGVAGGLLLIAWYDLHLWRTRSAD